MAKAKKEKSEDAPAKAAPKAAAKKTETTTKSATGKAKKPAKSAAAAAPPLIDTSLAAQAAARFVANRDVLSQAKTQAVEKRESGTFKQLKESALKPTVQGPGGLLQPPGAQKKFNPSVGARNQVGHNQTFGADVARTGVPRRTAG